ncbi:MAG TPA: aminotransferase class V-fold PLP-dependent enzyme, partial [Candidatus Paceibacterota bacterium]|nr:aminotransferase class V-fold PLP-dependent enzyme [Candidatus Paceibacterota bacterium]
MGKRIYLDYAASTPLDPQVEKVFVQNLRLFGNPGSLHSFGQEALAIIDEARLKIANFFGVHSSDV